MFLSTVAATGPGGGGPVSAGAGALLTFCFGAAIGVSLICSVWEAVILKVTSAYIAQLRTHRPVSGARLDDLKTRIERPLTSLLILNTFAHAAAAMAVALQVSAPGGGIREILGGFVATVAILIASKVFTKNLGERYWENWAPWSGFCLAWLTRLMTPALWVLGIFRKNHHNETTFSRDELKVMAQLGIRQGELKEDESRILENLLQLSDISVREVMTPRVVVFALNEDTTVKHYLERHDSSPFSRVPIYSENRDDIRGFVLKHDILLAAAQGKDSLKLKDLRRSIAAIPRVTKLTDAFQHLVANRHHISIVLDEYGGMSGLVTMEDIVETLLGLEIVDEADTRDDMQEFARNLWKSRAVKMGLELDQSRPLESVN